MPLSVSALAADPAGTPDLPANTPLPEIEARTHDVKPLQTSTNGRVYRLDIVHPKNSEPTEGAPSTDEKTAAPLPAVGRILLIHDQQENILAMRVLKNLPETSQIIAKRVRQYGQHSSLELEKQYTAIEKLSDKEPPPLTPQDKEDIVEVDQPLPFDPDLDAGSSPNPDGSGVERTLDSATDDENEERRIGLTVEDFNAPYQSYKHWLSTGMAMLRNTPGTDRGSEYYTGGGVRYAITTSERLFATDQHRIDFLSLEGSLYYYKITGLNVAEDSYTVVPVLLTGRYTYFLNEDWAGLAYVGVQKNFVTTSGGNDDSLSSLSQVAPVIGVGGLLRVGPQWYARLDAGTDMLSLSVMLRF